MTITLGLLSTYLFFSMLLGVFFSAYSLSKRTTSLVKVFSALCIFISIYLFGYLLEINSSSLNQMIFWNQIQYIGIPFYPAFWLILSLIYSETILYINKRIILSIFIIPSLIFLIRLTNPLHHIYYNGFELKTTSGFSFLSLDKGFLYYIYCSYLIISFILSIFCYIRNYRNRGASERARYNVMIFASLLPFIGLSLILMNPGNLGIDYVILVLPLSLLLMILALFKYDFLELKTLARDILFDKSTDAMILIDNKNRILDFNQAAKVLFNQLDNAVNKKPIEKVLYENPKFIELLEKNIKKDLSINYGDKYGYFEVKTVTIEDIYGHPCGRLITLVNITKRKNAQEVLKVLATTDYLTGVLNRGKFIKLAELTMNHSKKSNIPFSLLMIDVDHFKNLNDTKGHAAGDAILKYLGSQMRNFFRRDDIIGRLGGEEFAVILPNTPLKDAEKLAEKFHQHISSHPAPYENTCIHFTFSMGVSTYNMNFLNFNEILKLADEGLYESKTNGRNRITTKVAN